MMFPIYFVVGLINLLAQQKNYGIQNQDPNFDIRVRRSIPGTTQELFNQHTIQNIGITRQKRYAYYKKTKINNNYYNGNNNLINTGNYENQGFNEPRNNYNELRNNYNEPRNNFNEPRNSYNEPRNIYNEPRTNYNEPRNMYNGSSNLRYNIFNPNYNIPFNNTRRNNTKNIPVNNRNIRPYIRSYPYGYPPGYGPNTTPGYNATGYNQNNANTPQFYNYQNPNGNNFAGFYGYSSTTPGYNRIVAGYNVPLPYTPINTPRPYNRPWETQLAPFPTTSTPDVAINNTNNRFQPTYNNFNNIPTPYGQNNNSVNYVPFNTTQNTEINTPTLPNTYVTNSSNNTFVDNTVGNSSVTNSTVTTTEKIVTSCVICNIPCPAFMKRFGRFCISEDEEE